MQDSKRSSAEARSLANGRKKLATKTDSTLPNLELAAAFDNLDALLQVLRTPFSSRCSSTARSFCSKMVSADLCHVNSGVNGDSYVGGAHCSSVVDRP